MEFKAEGFKTLPETLEWAKTNSFDILISDYYLDNMTSAQHVLHALVELKGKTFKSFVLTNYIDESKKNELRIAGFTEIIEKPLTIEKIKQVTGL